MVFSGLDKEQLNLVLINFGDLNWTHVEKPARKEFEFLAQTYPLFRPLNLDDYLSQSESVISL